MPTFSLSAMCIFVQATDMQDPGCFCLSLSLSPSPSLPLCTCDCFEVTAWFAELKAWVLAVARGGWFLS